MNNKGARVTGNRRVVMHRTQLSNLWACSIPEATPKPPRQYVHTLLLSSGEAYYEHFTATTTLFLVYNRFAHQTTPTYYPHTDLSS
jgi:hypothetical protein